MTDLYQPSPEPAVPVDPMAVLLQSVFDVSLGGIAVLASICNEQGDIIDFVYQLANRVVEQATGRTDLPGKR